MSRVSGSRAAGRSGASIGAPTSDQIVVYIEDMLGELAKLASSAGHDALAESLRKATVEAIRAGRRTPEA